MTPPVPKALDLSFLADRRVRRRIAASTFLLAVLGGLYGFLAPGWYRSQATLVPGKSQKGGGLSSLLGGDMAGLAAGFEGALGATADSVRIAAVLKSNAVTDAVIEKFDLKSRYSAGTQEAARESLWKHCDVRTLAKPNLVEVSCEDKDPRFARDMLTFFADYANDVFRRVSVGSASEEVRFLDRRVADLRKQADAAATQMREFQERHQIVDLDSQAKAVVASMATLHGQRINRQMELDYTTAFSSSEEAGARQLRSQLGVVDETLRELEQADVPGRTAAGGSGRSRKAGGMFPAALAVPKLRAEFEKLYRDRKVAELTLLYALERLEGARANEARDVSTFQILDPPTLATRKSRPRGSMWALIGAMVGLLGSIGVEWWRSRKVAGA